MPMIKDSFLHLLKIIFKLTNKMISYQNINFAYAVRETSKPFC